MAKIEVVMPQMGESITTGTITKWHKGPGDTIELDEILLEISTDKVESEIPSPIQGKIIEILYPEGTTVDVGKPIAMIDDDMNAVASSAAPKAAAVKTENKTAPKGVSGSETGANPNEIFSNDALKTSAAAKAPVIQEAPASTHEEGFRFYTPLVKAMAQEAGIPLNELSKIKGSGAGNRVNKADLENYIASRGKGGSKPAPAASQGVAKSTAPSGRVEIIPMDNMRKAIARNMVQSKLTSPHVNSVDEIDFTKLVKFREGFKHEFQKREGFSLTYTHFILYALIQALKAHPMVNASIDGDNIVLKKDINLGCAVAVPGNGLVVPVIKNAGDLNITGLARAVNDLAGKARSKKLTLEDLTGGTFTFTNVGSFGTLLATPVILQPQLGIFAAGVIKKRVMVMEDDSLAIRSMMYGTHTYDHRLVDGELGGKFLATVKEVLETLTPEELF